MSPAREDGRDPTPFVTLWGDEHPDLGEVSVTPLGDRAAIGLSAGRLPKPYWHLDPNEDAVLAMDAGHTLLVAVADGHNGFDAALAAMTAVHDVGQRLLHQGEVEPTDVLWEVAAEAAAAVRREVPGLEAPRDGSRTALSVALVRDGAVHALTFGDTVVARVRGGRAKGITHECAFLGPRPTIPSVASAKLRPGDLTVLCSDGVTDHLGREPLTRLGSAMSEVSQPELGVYRLLELAAAGGAGDHLAVALVGP